LEVFEDEVFEKRRETTDPDRRERKKRVVFENFHSSFSSI
jgi:hypothetical protein